MNAELLSLDKLQNTKADLKRKLNLNAKDTVFVMGLPTFYDEKDVRALFQDCG